MKIQALFLILVVGLVWSEPSFETDEGVLVLTEENFDDVVNHFEHVLVMFYAPWCGHCKKLKPEYAAAAQQLAEEGSDIKIAKVDATEEKDLGGRFEVQGYPTLKFFIGGTPIDYQGPRDQAGIVKWVNKKTQPSTQLLSDAEALEAARSGNEVLVVFFGTEDSVDFGTWQTVSKGHDDLVFNHVFDTGLAAEFGQDIADGESGISLFKQFDEGRNDFDGEWTVDSINDFIRVNSVPTIMPFDQKAAQMIFGGGESCMFLFTEDGEDSDRAMEALTEASPKLKGNILMSTSGVVDGLDKRLADYVGVTGDLPQLWIVDPSGGDLKKFVFEGSDLVADQMVQFFEDFQGGNLAQHVKSEPVPESQDAPVYQLVGLNWEDVVMDKSQDVLVKYYAPWCGHCKKMAPMYEELATELAAANNLVIAEMDATANEVEGLQVQGFPTIKFYPANNKNGVDFEGDRTKEGFLTYLQEHVSGQVTFDFETMTQPEQGHDEL